MTNPPPWQPIPFHFWSIVFFTFGSIVGSFLNVCIHRMLRGKCNNCGAPISIRYFLVEFLSAVLFLCSWLAFGAQSAALAVVHCLLLAGFIVATFIDFEHFIIPDEITLGGVAVGFVASFFVPLLHRAPTAALSLERCFTGVIAGAGLVYGLLRLGNPRD